METTAGNAPENPMSDGASAETSPSPLTAPPSTSERRAGSRPPPKPGKPRGLGTREPLRKRKRESSVENGGNLQVNKRKKGKENEPSASTQVPEEQQRTGEVMFRLKVALKDLHGDFEIRAPGNQPILDALQADTRLKKIKKKLHKICLHPCGETPLIKGVPNIGSPCHVIEGGRFEAKLQGKDQSPNKYTNDQLKSSERYKIYFDVKDRPSLNAKWLTKENPKTFLYPLILIDCLPDDTFLSAFYRDARIDNNKLKNAKLMCKDSTDEINIKLTTMCSLYDGKTFSCKVAKDKQVSEEEWNQTVVNSPDVVLSDTDESYGTPDSQGVEAETDTGSWKLDPQVVKGAAEMIRKSQRQVAKLLSSKSKVELKFEKEKKKTDENRRKKELNKIFRPFRQDYYNANQGTRVELLEKLCKLACSVGIVVKNGHALGTCFRVGSRYVLTNKHVTKIAGLSVSSNGSDVCVCFSYKRDLQPFREGQDIAFKVLHIVHSSDGDSENIDELDYSLLELEVLPDQSAKLPPGLGHKIEQTLQNATVTIIGHPGGRPKEVDTSCPVVGTKHSITVYLKFHPECRASPMINNPKRNNYKSSFDGGSSGSPGFDDYGNLVVMHACGYHLYKRSETEVAQGVGMTAVRDDLKQHLPAELWDDLFLPPTEDMEVD